MTNVELQNTELEKIVNHKLTHTLCCTYLNIKPI